MTLTASGLTLLFIGIVVCLTAALVRVFWQLDQRLQQRKGDRPR